MMPPVSKPVLQIVREQGIPKKTLYAWRRELLDRGMAVPKNGQNAGEWSSAEKFAVVVETASLNSAELAEYCRRKGLFAEQIAAWREACSAANESTGQLTRKEREQAKSDRIRIRKLEKELDRKEKALAEAAALLILRKKAQAIWGDKEEE